MEIASSYEAALQPFLNVLGSGSEGGTLTQRHERCDKHLERLLEVTLEFASSSSCPPSTQASIYSLCRLLDDQIVRFEIWSTDAAVETGSLELKSVEDQEANISKSNSQEEKGISPPPRPHFFDLIEETLSRIEEELRYVSASVIQIISICDTSKDLVPTNSRLSDERDKATDAIGNIDHLIGNLFNLVKLVVSFQAVRLKQGPEWHRKQRMLAVKTFSQKKSDVESSPPLSSPQITSFKPQDTVVRVFKQRLQEFTLLGMAGRPYIHISRLKTWLSPSIIDALLKATIRESDSTFQSIKYLTQKRALLVFSILLDMDAGELLCLFLDDKIFDSDLPLSRQRLMDLDKDEGWPDTCTRFEQHQCKFCPVILESKFMPDLPARSVLPITRKLEIFEVDTGYLEVHRLNSSRTQDVAESWEVEILEEFLPPSLRRLGLATVCDADDTVGPRYRFTLRNFQDPFLPSQGLSPRGMLGQHSAIQVNSCEFVLNAHPDETSGLVTKSSTVPVTRHFLVEYAELSLEMYFAQNAPPVFQEEIDAFWLNLFGITDALKYLEYSGDLGQKSWKNYLFVSLEHIVCVQGKFKLSLPGYLVLDEKITHSLFAPPEVIGGSSSRQLFSRFHVWSFGCVLSIAATWIVLGHQGVTRFARLRQEAILMNLDKARAGRGDSFHDGQKVLEEVLDWHRLLRGTLRRSDRITANILDLLDSGAMWSAEPGFRISAGGVHKSLLSIILPASVPHDRSSASFVGNSSTADPRERVFFPQSSNPSQILVPDSSKIEQLSISREPVESFSREFATPIEQAPSHGKPASKPQNFATLSALRDAVRHDQDKETPSLSDSLTLPSKSSKAMPYLRKQTASRLTSLNRTSSTTRGQVPKQMKPRTSQNIFQAREEMEVRDKRAGLLKTWSRPKDNLIYPHFRNRQMIFLLDNSASMGEYWGETKYLLETLLLKLQNVNKGFTVHLTHAPSGKGVWKERSVSEKSISRILGAMEKSEFRPTANNTDAFAKSMSTVFQDLSQAMLAESGKLMLSNARNGLTLFVLTDDIFKATSDVDDLQVEQAIGGFCNHVIRSQSSESLEKSFSIQFIQLGDSLGARADLNSLQKSLLDKGIPKIIDIEPSNGDINKMLLGSFTSEYDEAGDIDQYDGAFSRPSVATGLSSASSAESLVVRTTQRGLSDEAGPSENVTTSLLSW